MGENNMLDYTKGNVLKNSRPTIGLLVGGMESSFHEGIVRGAVEMAKLKDYNIIVFSGGALNSPHLEIRPRERILDWVNTGLLDGIIVTASSHSRYLNHEQTIEFVNRFSSVPIVNIGGEYDNVVNIMADFEQGMDQLFDHYVNVHGYKRIAFFRGPKNHATSERRMKIYIQLLQKYNLPYDENLIVYGDLNKNVAEHFIEEFYDKRKENCDAIITINDNSTLRIMELLKERNINVPEDVAISGSMAIIEGFFSTPKLTTITESSYEFGVTAVKAMGDLFDGVTLSSTILVPTELVVRESCGCKRTDISKHMQLLNGDNQEKITSVFKQDDIFDTLKNYCLNDLIGELRLSIQKDIVHFLDMYYESINSGEYDVFINLLKDKCVKNINKEEIIVWLEFTVSIEYSTLQLLDLNKPIKNIKYFLEQLIIITEEIQQQAIFYQRYKTNHYLNFFRNVEDNLNNSFDIDTIKNYVTETLDSLDWYISIDFGCKEGVKLAKNILSFHNNQKVIISPKEQIFDVKNLIPQCVKPYDDRYDLIVLPLYSRGESMGAMILSYSGKQGSAYENIQSVISTTLKNELQIQELKEAEERFSDIAHSTSDWLWEINENNIFTYCSSSVYDVLGYTSKEMLGINITEISMARNFEYLSLMENREQLINIEFYSHNKSREIVYLLISATPIIKNNKFVGYRGVFKNITKQKMQEKKIMSLAYYDILTGLPNRTLFQDQLEEVIRNSDNKQFALMFLDIDRFKKVNDTLGHSAGDLLLQKVSEVLKECIGKQDILARLSGDEFVVIIPDIQSEVDVAKVSKKMLREFKKPFTILEQQLYITLSIGIAIYPADGNNSSTLLKNADTAMYRGKEQGRNQSVFYDYKIEEINISRIKQEETLYKAIESEAFVIEYQPQVDTFTGKLKGVEALVRMVNEEGKIIYPNDFITLAEEISLIDTIDKKVFKEVCLQISNWRKKGLPNIKFSVNLSPLQLRNKNLVNEYMAVIDYYQIKTSNIQIEITENALIENEKMALMLLNDFSMCGFSIALDDFGTGNSSLRCISLFPIDTVKIDRSFVNSLATNSKSRGIISTIMHMAKQLDLNIIAEGVETYEQYEMIKSFGCNEIQGYYFSKPKDIKVIEPMINENYRLKREK